MGRMSWLSYWAVGSLSINACSRKDFSASARSSSEMGAGPSFSSPAALLNAWGLVYGVGAPFVCGMSEERRPVLTSQDVRDLEALVVATVISPYRRD